MTPAGCSSRDVRTPRYRLFEEPLSVVGDDDDLGAVNLLR
jgi:hypothetical protein